MYVIQEYNDKFNSIIYDNCKDIRIKVVYLKNNIIEEQNAIKKFWYNYERLRQNSLLTREYK